MNVDGSQSAPEVLTGPGASLRVFKQAMHLLAKILQYELRKIDSRFDVQIVTYIDDGDAECFPLQEVAACSEDHQHALEDRFREIQALIEEAKAIQKVVPNQKTGTTLQEIRGALEGDIQSNMASPAHGPSVKIAHLQTRRSFQEGMWLSQAADAATQIPQRVLHNAVGIPQTCSQKPDANQISNSAASCEPVPISTRGSSDEAAPVFKCSTAAGPSLPVAESVPIAETGTCRADIVPADVCLDHHFMESDQALHRGCKDRSCGQSMAGSSRAANTCDAGEQPPGHVKPVRDCRPQAATTNCTGHHTTDGTVELDSSSVRGNSFATDGRIIASPPVHLVNQGMPRQPSLHCTQQTLPTVGLDSMIQQCHLAPAQPVHGSSRTYDRKSQPSCASLASEPGTACAVDVAGQTGGQYCPVPSLNPERLFIYDIFRSDDSYVPEPSQAGNAVRPAVTSSGHVSQRHHHLNAPLDAVSDDSVADAEGGPITPPARRSREVACLGSAPAAVWRQLEAPVLDPGGGGCSIQNIFSSAGFHDHQHDNAAHRAMSVDSYQEAVRNISAPDATAQGAQGAPTDGGGIEWQQEATLGPSSLRSLASTFQSSLEPSWHDPRDGVASGSALPNYTRYAGLRCPPGDPILPFTASQRSCWHVVEARLQGSCGVQDLATVGRSPHLGPDVPRSDSIPSDQRFADPDSSDEAPLEPPPPVYEASPVASPVARGAKQLRRAAQVQQSAAACAQGSHGAAVHHMQHMPPSQLSEPSMAAEDEATVPPADPVSYPPSSPAVHQILQVGEMPPRVAGASCSQELGHVAPAEHHQLKRGRPHAPDEAEDVHMCEEWLPRRFHEPCSEHVEGVFPSHAAKRSRLADDSFLPPFWSGRDEAELEDNLEEGPVTVDHIQRVVERRLQITPGWRAQRRQVHLARAQRQEFREFIQRILENDPTLGECGSRVLRLKPTLDLDTTTFEIDMVLEALRYNHRIEALYIHNFEQGFADLQLERLMKVLRNGRIWACNIGENFLVTNEGWKRFLRDIPETALAFTYVSEAHLKRTDLKVKMRAAIRLNRILSPRRDPEVCKHISNMWFNPTGCNSRHYGCASEKDHDRHAAAAASIEQVIADRQREVAAITRAKAIYAKFASFRNDLLRNKVDPAAREKAVDPREAELRLQSKTTKLQRHEMLPVNVHVVPELQPFLEAEQSHGRLSLYTSPAGSVDTHDLPCCVREVMVPYAHLPAAVLRRCGKEVDGIEEEQEAEERRQAVVASNERAEEVAAGIAERGLEAIIYAVGPQAAQQRWIDERRIRRGFPRDFSDDTLAWAVKCVGGHLAARKEIEAGLSALKGRRIDIFLPVYVQWVAAWVQKVDHSMVTVKFWNGQTTAVKLQDSLVAWKLPRSESMPLAGVSIEMTDSYS